MRRASNLFLLFCLSVSAYSQSVFEEDFRFIQHLETIAAPQEGLLFIEKIKPVYTSVGQRDTLNFYLGKFEYYQKNLFQSVTHFNQVSQESLNYWIGSKFYAGLEYAHLGNYDLAGELFNEAEALSELQRELRNLELAGLAMLTRSENRSVLVSQFDDQYFQLKEYQEALVWVNNELDNHKTKSPVIAGLFSAVIPGTGKYYAGMFGQGTMSMMTSAIFGLQAYEGYRKRGPKSASFIVFGSIFSVFYVANIWGSVVAVSIQERDFNTNMNETILVNMHVPVRLLFK